MSYVALRFFGDVNGYHRIELDCHDDLPTLQRLCEAGLEKYRGMLSTDIEYEVYDVSRRPPRLVYSLSADRDGRPVWVAEPSDPPA